MALMLRVPTPLRCRRMPARMASLSLGWFLHPPEIKRPAESHAASAIRFISEAFLIPMCLSILPGRKSVGNHWQAGHSSFFRFPSRVGAGEFEVDRQAGWG